MSKRLLVAACSLALAAACGGRRAPRPGGPPPSVQEGLASWYGIDEAGRSTASGEPMDPEGMTAAHLSLPFGSLVRVTDLDTGRQVQVVVNDRGPHVRGRIIDLSYGAARELGIVGRGIAPVRIEVIGLEGPLAERRWRVQVGSFADAARADEVALALQAEGFSPVVVSPYEEGAMLFFRVWVGAFFERDGAERLARKLQLRGHGGFVLLARASTD